MLLEQHGTSRRGGFQQQSDAPRHVESWTLVVEPDDLVPERLLGELAAVGVRRQRDHGVGVRVVDVGGRDEGVEERLDRRARLIGPHCGRAQIVDHRCIVHLGPLAERQQLVEP